MKKIICCIIWAFLFWQSYSFGQTISSRNAVGYVKFSADPEELMFVSNPFETISGPTSLEALLEGKVPFGTQIFRWNDGTQMYETVSYVTTNVWIPNDPTPLTRGAGYFVQIGATGVGTTTIYLYGQVPGASSVPTTSIPLAAGLTSIGYPYPGEVTVENSGLNDVTSPGDVLFLWDHVAQSYKTVSKLTLTFWNPPNTVLKPGQGIFISKSAGANYVETVPYSWPNN